MGPEGGPHGGEALFQPPREGLAAGLGSWALLEDWWGPFGRDFNHPQPKNKSSSTLLLLRVPNWRKIIPPTPPADVKWVFHRTRVGVVYLKLPKAAIPHPSP